MRGKRRTKQERNELFAVLESYLAMGFSLKKACSLAGLPYSSMRDITTLDEPLRAHTRALQNTVNVKARINIINSIEQGNVQDSKWWLEKFDHLEPQESPVYGGVKEGYLTVRETRIEWENESVEEASERMRDFLINL